MQCPRRIKGDTGNSSWAIALSRAMASAMMHLDEANIPSDMLAYFVGDHAPDRSGAAQAEACATRLPRWHRL